MPSLACQPSTAALYTVCVSLLVPSPSHSGPAKKSHSLLSASFFKKKPVSSLHLSLLYFFMSAPDTAEALNLCAANEIFRKITCSPPSQIQESLSNFCIYDKNSQRTCFKRSILLILTRHLLRSSLWLLEQSEMWYYMLPPTFAFQTQCSYLIVWFKLINGNVKLCCWGKPL